MIHLDNTISVKTINTLYQAIKKGMKDEDEIIVDFTDVERVDLSVIQVILSAGRQARKEGKTVKLKGVSDYVKSQMQLCGLKT